MTTFTDKLAELRERATKGPYFVDGDLTNPYHALRAFLVNHAEAIEKVVRAAEMVMSAKGIEQNAKATIALHDALNELEGK